MIFTIDNFLISIRIASLLIKSESQHGFLEKFKSSHHFWDARDTLDQCHVRSSPLPSYENVSFNFFFYYCNFSSAKFNLAEENNMKMTTYSFFSLFLLLSQLIKVLTLQIFKISLFHLPKSENMKMSLSTYFILQNWLFQKGKGVSYFAIILHYF